MKYIPIVGIGLAIWGLVTQDWFKVGFGVILFLTGFAVDLFKKKGVMKDDKVFQLYKVVSQIVHTVRESLDSDKDSSKSKLAQGLFFLGLVDGASQSAGMSEEQFNSLFRSVFADLDHIFDESYQDKLLHFHNNSSPEHSALPAIIKGGELFINFAKGNSMAPLAGGMLVEELINSSSFPSSINEL
ncbi:MAG: hypothetical protein AB2558_21285, partial [Candidatus Thiodiazotropha sp.]|nr:hypothetical protein [Candidatus Thiodiazotropha taylori]